MRFAVIFDMDGVIVDNGKYHQQAWEAFSKKYNIPFSEKKFNTVYFGRTNEQILPKLFNRDLSRQEIKKLGDEKEAVYREIYRQHLKAVPGFIHFLEELKTYKIPVGVATSAPKENVDFVLHGLTIEKMIDVIVDDSMVSRGKPDPEIYLKAAQLLETDIQHCVVFEDSLSGTQAAFNAGAKVIAITTTVAASKHKFAHRTVSDFSEISVNFIRDNMFN